MAAAAALGCGGAEAARHCSNEQQKSLEGDRGQGRGGRQLTRLISSCFQFFFILFFYEKKLYMCPVWLFLNDEVLFLWVKDSIFEGGTFSRVETCATKMRGFCFGTRLVSAAFRNVGGASFHIFWRGKLLFPTCFCASFCRFSKQLKKGTAFCYGFLMPLFPPRVLLRFLESYNGFLNLKTIFCRIYFLFAKTVFFVVIYFSILFLQH